MPIATLKGYVQTPKVKNLKYLQLWDLYGALLTENQREICELYYGLDLSLAEIAEQKGVSRQSISETLKKSRQLLDEYEEKLKHNELNQEYSLKVSLMMTEVLRELDKLKQFHPDLSAEIEGIMKLVTVGEEIDLDAQTEEQEREDGEKDGKEA